MSSLDSTLFVDDTFLPLRQSHNSSVLRVCENNGECWKPRRGYLAQSALCTRVRWICVLNNASRLGRHAKRRALWAQMRVEALAFTPLNEKHFSTPIFSALKFNPHFVLALKQETSLSPWFILRKCKLHEVIVDQAHRSNLPWPHQKPHLPWHGYICDLR